MSPVGYITLPRRYLEWEWYQDIPVARLFFHLVLSARWKQGGRWQGAEVGPGQFPTSLPSLSEQTGLTIQQVRTALAKLRSTGEITEVSTNSYRLITIQNWPLFQGGSTDIATDEQQASNRPATDDQQTINSTRRKEEGKKGRSKGARTPADPQLDEQVAQLLDLFEGYGTRSRVRAHWRKLPAEARAEIMAKAPAYVASTAPKGADGDTGKPYRCKCENWIKPEDERWKEPIVTAPRPQQLRRSDNSARIDMIKSWNR